VMHYNFEFDFDKKKLIPGGSFYMRVVESWNDRIKGDVGSLSIPAYAWGNIGDHEILVDKWWWRQRFLNDRIEIRVGKLLNVIDLFDTNAYAGNPLGQFTNGWLTANPTVPTTRGLGAFIKAWPTNWLYFQTGAMDPDQVLTKTGFDTAFHGPDHFRGFWEFGFTPKWETSRGKLPGNYRFGWWYDPQPKEVFQSDSTATKDYETGDVGLYTNFDQLVWKENANPADKQGLGVFGRYGFAHGERNRLEYMWSVGAQYEGLLPDRNHDVLAFGVAQGILSDTYRHDVRSSADRETVYELYYLIEITPWLYITPDIQVITNPGGDRYARDALVGGVRLKVAF
jgi:porin